MGIPAREPRTMGPFRLPREGGIYGVWLATLLLGLTHIDDAPAQIAALWLASMILTLLLVERVRFDRDLKAALLPAMLLAPLLIQRPLHASIAALLSLALLVASLKTRTPIYSIIAGGALLASEGTILLAVLGRLEAGLAGLAHEFTAVAQAAIAVTKGSNSSVTIFYAALASMIAASTTLVLGGWASAGYVLLLDSLARFAMVKSGLVYRIRLKTYGMLEVLHSGAIMTLLGLLT